jgi:dihydrofolate reductase
MTKLIMWNLQTLDGYFEGAKSWDLDFHQQVWGDELERLSIDQLHTAGMLLFGRVTYEGMAAYWQTATGEVADLMNSLPKVVFSRTLERADWANTKLVKPKSAADVVEEVQNLKRRLQGELPDEVPNKVPNKVSGEVPDKAQRDIFVFGSANLSAALMEHGLFDEYRIALVPVVLGKGKPLFGASPSPLKLKLLDTRTLSNGCVILRYEPQSGH